MPLVWEPGAGAEGGREALFLPEKSRGRKQTLACRQVAMALANLKQGN